ncbi:MAG: hypothetical protein LBN24_00420 [Mediterranea sp.]|nr:hypothetical protein [Mediterranea sp.]
MIIPKKYGWACLCAAVLLTNCTQPELPSQASENAIRLLADANGLLTRTPFVSTMPTSLSPLTADVYISQASQMYSSAYWWNPGNVAALFSDPYGSGFASPIQWPDKKASIYSTAFSPSGAWKSNDNNATFTAPLSASTDLMVSPEVTTPFRQPVNLHFKHATMFVRVFMNSAPDVSTEWGTLEGISISKLNGNASRPKELAYHINTGLYSTSAALTTQPLPLCIVNERGVEPVYTDTPLTNAHIDVLSTRFRLVGYAMVRGGADNLGETELDVACQYQSRRTTVDLSGIGYGRAINIYLTLQSDGITLMHEVMPWDKEEGSYNDPDKSVHKLTLSSGSISFGSQTQTYGTPENLLKVTTGDASDKWELTIPKEAEWLNARVGLAPEHGTAQENGSTIEYTGTNYICFLSPQNNNSPRSCTITLTSANNNIRMEVEIHQEGVSQ